MAPQYCEDCGTRATKAGARFCAACGTPMAGQVDSGGEFGALCTFPDGKVLRPASRSESEASLASEQQGVIIVDGLACFVADTPECRRPSAGRRILSALELVLVFLVVFAVTVIPVDVLITIVVGAPFDAHNPLVVLVPYAVAGVVTYLWWRTRSWTLS